MRTWSVVVKYMVVVGVSCFLAYIISQMLASASELALPGMATPALNNAGVCGKLQAVPTVPYKIESSLETWRDGPRMREVPVKVYFPVIPAGIKPATRFPVILFSHGLGGTREGGQCWAAHWASHGFVVVAMQHAGSDEGLWMAAPPRDIAISMKAGMTASNLLLRVGDVHFVIDEVRRRTERRASAFVNADPQRLGMSGHSFGAQTTLVVAGQKAATGEGQSGLDARVVAAIAFSPNARNKNNLVGQFGDIRMPFFSITGSQDASVLGDVTAAADRRLPYENMPAGQKYLAVFDGGDHMVFGGHGLANRRPETPRDKKIQQDVMSGTLAFWNAYLNQDAASRLWLDEGGFRSTMADNDIFEHK